ncbi:MAG TPA: DsbE family thiol:disulfide interchange protein [Rudaea sp.]|jgi:cytochrome c biogenesis protein CcmG/thiol:disulfide interchange protein DsbE|nr:DsbE family thiol:disulfide interchange protein [Rudaea sp.]
MSRLLPLLGFVLIVALLAFGIHWNRSHDMNWVPSPLIDKPAPEFTLPLLYDSTKSLSRKDMLGKPWLLNVFGSWCVTCQDEHPVLMAYGKKLGLPLIGMDWKDDPDTAKRWLAQFGNPYDTIIADENGKAGIDFGVYGAPETYLVDAQGTIRYKHIGNLTPEIIASELKPAIGKLGKERP